MLRHILWAVLGAGAGYYVGKKHLEAGFDKRLQEEVEATRAFYKSMYDKRLEAEVAKLSNAAVNVAVDTVISSKVPEGVELVDAVSPHPDIPEQTEPEEEMTEEAVAALVNYQGMSTASAAEPVGNLMRPIVERVPREEEELTYVKPDGPRIISFKEYEDNGGDYAQHTVVFYSKDSAVSNEADTKLSEEYVGSNISYANLGKLNADNSTIYVRHDGNQVDFEVIWSPNSYRAEVENKLDEE